MPSIKKPPPEEAEAARPPSLKKHPSVDSSGGRPSSIKKPTPAEDAAATRAALEHQDRVKKMAEERYLFEQRALTLCTGMIVLIAVLWTVALSTDHWYELDPPQGGLYLRGSKTVLRDGHTGLWRMCTDQFHPPNLTAYLSITTAGPEVTSKRPRAQPCKMMKLRGQKRKRCRQELKRRFKSALAAKRRASLSRIDAVTASPGTTPTPDAAGDGNATNGTDSEWLGAQFDDAVSADTVAAPDPVDEEVNLEAVSPEEEVFFEKAEEEIRERVFDGEDENQTINETLTEVVQQVAKEFTEVSFYECNPRELSEYGLEPASVEWQMLSYMRTLLTFSVVSLLLLLLGFLSALYTFKEPRYTFKRLSAGIQFIACCGLVVVIQVFRSAVEYERWQELGGVDMAVGYSQVLAWLSLCMQFVSSFLFLLYSRKRKRNKAPNEEIGMADEPTIIGR